MKKILLLLALFLTFGCYDDSEIRGELREYEARLTTLETLCQQANSNIEALQTVVSALEKNVYVSAIVPVKKNGEEIGYAISFTNAETITIYHGQDGANGEKGNDGATPVIGLRRDTGGIYYWTLNGEWLIDDTGNKVPVSGKDGSDGLPGTSGPQGPAGKDGLTPTLKMVDGYWYVSYDGGKTWEEETLGQATGDNGYTMFEKVEYDQEYVYITMAGGEKLTLPRTLAGQGAAGPLTCSLDKVTVNSATFSGILAIPADDLPFSQVTVYYSDAETFNVYDALGVSTTIFDGDQKFTITITGLEPNVKYNYCLIAEVKSEKTYGDVKSFTTISLVAPSLNDATDVTEASAVISGTVSLASGTASDLEYGIQYSATEDFSSGVTSKKITDIDSENRFSLQVSSLVPETAHYYRSYIRMNGVYGYGEIKSFTTLQNPYEVQFDLNMSASADLSSSATANSYIVSKGGLYKIKTVKGNSTTSVGSVVSASILWETFGTSTTPNLCELIKGVCYKDGYIAFQTADTFKEGNVVIAAKDADGNILWSWHIWFTDEPQGQEYYNNAGTMMDRNLGATSATPGDVGALGLLYQWGRKDPFLGSSSISDELEAKSTITWPSTVSDSFHGTIEYATSHPTTFITRNDRNYDWYYTGLSSTDNTRWTTLEKPKSIYDPCPAGWRVPDGGSNGVWSKALSSSSSFDYTYSSSNEGMNFSGKFGSASTIWYPASGFRSSNDGGQSSVGNDGYYWSASPDSSRAFGLYFSRDGRVLPSNYDDRAGGYSVRCLQE